MTAKQKKPSKEKTVLELSNTEAMKFFLKPESYCNVDLPDYFKFDPLLKKVHAQLSGKQLKSFQKTTPRDFEQINHSMLSNKDGRHAWRPFQLIHPALYVSLVSKIAEATNWKTIQDRFTEFSNIQHFKCLSIPIQSSSKKKTDKAAQILRWWSGVEQASITSALDYSYVFHADISDCYSSIYTHSIAWALHGRDQAKTNKNNPNFIGNIIDCHMQDMHYGQTNGIPQGSVLMDFVAEMVLGYADSLLSERINEGIDYKIIRYRDDYRIFVNNPPDGERILKSLTEVLIGLGLKLNTLKTTTAQSVVMSAIKQDKRAFLLARQGNRDLRKHLLILHAHGERFPNSGSLTTALTNFYQRILKMKKIRDPLPLISIALDIAWNSPRTFPVCAAIISKLLVQSFSKDEQVGIIRKIHKKLSQLPNVGQIEIWLQRISYPHKEKITFSEPLCRLVDDEAIELWNNDWIANRKLKTALDSKAVIDTKRLKLMKLIVQLNEVDLFSYDS